MRSEGPPFKNAILVTGRDAARPLIVIKVKALFGLAYEAVSTGCV